MNWLGLDWRSLGAAVLGSVLGFFAFGALHHAGVELPAVVGLLVGVAAAAAARDRAPLRGLVLGVLAVWAAAAAQVHYVLAPARGGAWAGLLAFHQSLDPASFALHALGFALACFLGGRSLRRGAERRTAGA